LIKFLFDLLIQK